MLLDTEIHYSVGQSDIEVVYNCDYLIDSAIEMEATYTGFLQIMFYTAKLSR
jgi:hypothetical protein